MKLFGTLTAIAVSAILSTAAMAGGSSAGVGGVLAIGGNAGYWATGGAAAQGSVNSGVTPGYIYPNTGVVNNTSSSQTVNGYAMGSSVYPKPVSVAGVGGASYSNNTVVSQGANSAIQSNSEAYNASGWGTGLGGALIVGGGFNQH
jgi:hypothetical protein